VIAKRAGEVDNRVLIAGGHLDSVEEGPGIQDNGTGTAALLTIAEEFAKMNVRPRNSIRFAFWGGEEHGLKGSTHYVTKLSERELSRIALNLNFDMIGSPNYVRFVYDGNGTIGPAGPPGSDVIEDVFVEYFDSLGLASEPTEFDGRSDYQAFINAGIPAGGLFTGAEEIKTAEQARIYGGRAGVAYDPCYHEACDDIDNPRNRALNEIAKAAAHAIVTFAQTREDISPARVAQRIGAGASVTVDYFGPHLVR